ncbi:hypothetical protein IKN40_04430 [bacterium]|nr:hypothetical protein [bacterium]
MTKISHIVSTDLLDLIDGRDFYMCLANIASKNEDYCNFYKQQVEKGAFVLLDNGAAESDQMTLDVMLSVIKKINPTEVILNDSLSNCDETIERSLQALKFYQDNNVNCQFMFVAQGQNFSEWARCLTTFPELSKISTIGVSKFNTSVWKEDDARLKCCELINNLLPEKPIHLLGCHKDIREVAKISSQCINIRSNDTAFAQICAMSYQNILDGERPHGEMNFIESYFSEGQKQLLKQNIKLFDNLINEEQ